MHSIVLEDASFHWIWSHKSNNFEFDLVTGNSQGKDGSAISFKILWNRSIYMYTFCVKMGYGIINKFLERYD
jgi:hypothetical protein